MNEITSLERVGQAAIRERLDPTCYPKSDRPMFSGESVRYEASEKVQAICWGGLGLVRQLVHRLDVARAIDNEVEVLARHFPYHESDHILNLVYNFASGGRTLEAVESRRQDIAYLDALGVRRIPGASTAGDFLRRFEEEDIEDLLEVMQKIGKRAWKGKRGKDVATIDVDGTIAEVCGDCREGADLAYNGEWGYAPLLVSLANSSEVLWIQNRPGSRPSHEGAVPVLERCAEACLDRGFKYILFRGDTAFSSIGYLDRWSDRGFRFVFGMKAHSKALSIAEALEESDFQRLERPSRESSNPRSRPVNQRQLVIVEKGYRNLELEEEHVAEAVYSTRRCKKEYRVIVLRKRIKVTEGQQLLEPEIRYHFYITNLPKSSHSAADIVAENNQRCDQENLFKQLKNQLEAMKMPTKSFLGNWAYMVIGCLVWNLIVWLPLLLPRKLRDAVARCDFNTFYREVILLPAQILRSGRRTIYRLLGFRNSVPWIMQAHQAIS